MNRKGLTLIEMIVFIVIFSIGVMGVLVLFYNTINRSSNPTIRLKGVEVASAVMDEILSRKFDNDTPNGGGTIPLSLVNIGKEPPDDSNTIQYDDVDDYNGLSCITGSSGCFEDITPGYRVNISVTCAQVASDGKITQAACPTTYKLITVRVEGHVPNETYVLKSLKANF